MILLFKSPSSLCSIAKYIFSLLFVILATGVLYSSATLTQDSPRRNVRRPPKYSTNTVANIDYFNELATNVDKLGKEITVNVAKSDKQNESLNLCSNFPGKKCKENIFRHQLELKRQKASAVQRLRQRLFTQLSESSKINQQNHNQKQDKPLSKRSGRRRSKLNRSKRAATAEPSRIWEHATIPYVFEPIFSADDKITIMLAMSIWENATCITFKEKEAADTDYIVFTVRPCGCCSFVGRKGNGAQPVSLGKKCRNIGIVLHELGHAIGFWHEHTRPDRDHYVDVILEHVADNKESNFNKMKPEEVNSLGEAYDFDSIMHYGRNTLARNTYQDTILPKRLPGSIVRPDIGQRFRLSPGDIRQTNKLYKCALCGRTFQEERASFGHKPKTGKSETCHWRIKAAYGQRILLNITALSFPMSTDCANGHLEVRDGPNSESPRIGRFCGGDVPIDLYSTGRRMWLEYKTMRGDDAGFTANYVTECGGEISSGEGIIASPTYDERYLPNMNCSWQITVEAGYIIVLTFESFELENDAKCEYDFLEIREGNTETDPLIGKYCGFSYPKELKSKANQLFIKFVSDHDVQKHGFYIAFVKEIDECHHEIHECDHVCINTIGGYRCECRLGFELKSDGKSCEKACGGVIKELNGTISSPSFPDLYPPDKTCEWVIDAPKNHIVVLTFTHFDLEAGPGKCAFDYLKVYPVGGAKKDSSVVHCGESIPEPITSKGSTMKIEFKSDKYDQKSGFSAVFASDINECQVKNGGCQDICTNTFGSYYCSCRNGFILQDDQRGCVEGCYSLIDEYSGTITSPNFPEEYPRNTECDWLLTAPVGHRIRLSFQFLSIEPVQGCIYDNVAIFDGDNKNASLIGRYCGSFFPELVISTSSKMMVSFTSDVSVQKKGFEAQHDTICGSILEATYTPQSIVSHVNYGILNYDTWEDCDWLLKAPEGFKVELVFQTFSLEYQLDCDYDSVILYDGSNDTAPVLGRFCGNTLPGRIVSESSNLLVKFTTDNTINKNGFIFDFKKVGKVPKKIDYVD